uniref:Ankyrin repeat domain-containing protein n=1 Tax=Pelodiscus sinensis TaxID=13735 RepID=K7FRL6_PELSI
MQSLVQAPLCLLFLPRPSPIACPVRLWLGEVGGPQRCPLALPLPQPGAHWACLSAGSKTPLQSFLGIAEQHVGPSNGTLITQTRTAITPEEYFDPSFELGSRDMGRPMELTTKTQKFKAKLWLCEDHPLSLGEQVAPIIDLMAISNALFAKLRDFITLAGG